MLELDCAARESGICAVVGMGARPGTSNLLAAMAVSRLDMVDDLYTAWPVSTWAESISTRRQKNWGDPRGADDPCCASNVHACRPRILADILRLGDRGARRARDTRRGTDRRRVASIGIVVGYGPRDRNPLGAGARSDWVSDDRKE